MHLYGPVRPSAVRAGSPVGSAHPLARDYSGDIQLCSNDFSGYAGRHELAHTARCESSEAFLLRILPDVSGRRESKMATDKPVLGVFQDTVLKF